jgi:hypothetical protein
MPRDIFILDCPEIRCPMVLLFVFQEFTGYFIRNKYNVQVIYDINQIHNDSVVLMGDAFTCKNPTHLLKSIAPNAIYIGWYWHKIDTTDLPYFIYTYENMLNIYYDVARVQELIQIRSFTNNVPFLLRANEDPLLVGTYPKNIKYDFCYMGWRYCEELVPRKFKGIYHGVCDHRKFLTYDQRKQLYLSSIFALGFQGIINVVSQHVSQRIFEGLAYGCIVLSNSLPACEQTNHIVVHVSSREEVEQKMIYYMTHPKEATEKIQAGYEFTKQFGTNQATATQFIDLIQNKFDISI